MIYFHKLNNPADVFFVVEKWDKKSLEYTIKLKQNRIPTLPIMIIYAESSQIGVLSTVNKSKSVSLRSRKQTLVD